jgi:hypothetical protein
MPSLRRRVEEMERLQLKRRLERKVKRSFDPSTGLVFAGRNGNVILVLPHPDPEPEDRMPAGLPSDGTGPILVLPDRPQSITEEDKNGNS